MNRLKKEPMELDGAGLRANVGRTLWLGFFKAFLVIMPVAVPFFQGKGLSMQEVFSLQALFAFVVMVTEAPSGYLADLIGRRRCLILGTAFSGVGYSLLVVADGFWTLALFETAVALSFSLTSGADLALLYDTELARGSSNRRQRQVVGKLYAVRTLSEAAAGVACSLLLAWGTLGGVVAAQVLVGWLPLLLALRLREPPTARLSAEGHLANMVRITRHLLRGDLILRLVFLALCVWSLTTFYAVWLLPKLWEQQDLGLAHFGYLWGGLCALSAVAGRWTPHLEERIGPAGVLAIMGLLPALGYLGLDRFGVAGGLLAASTFFIARGLGTVILTDALNSRVPSEFRATANSLASFGFRGLFVATGPPVGLAFDLWGLGTTLLMLAALSLGVFIGLIAPLIVVVRGLPAKAAG
ncbi:MAG: MFS transporter [Gammaproteobacteria bacterium]|nr:MFS transporter [Gammaproteobacteria bacterium]